MPTLAARARHLPRRIQALFDQLVGGGWELGLQAAVYLDGEPVAEVVAGHLDEARTRPVAHDTLFPVCSTGKGVLATLAHILAERGVVDYDRPIARWWSAFAAAGKSGLTLRHALAHQAGLAATPAFASLEEMCDFARACARVAGLAPATRPGTASAYHAKTFGWLVGGALVHAAGRSIPRLLHEEIAVPLGLERELCFGLDSAGEARFAPFIPQPAAGAQVSTAPAALAGAGDAPGLDLPPTLQANLPAVRRGCIPSSNGVMSARAIARHYAALMGPVRGVRLVGARQLELATALHTPPGQSPPAFGHGWGLGYCLKGPAGEPGALFGHGGAGGSEGMANQRTRVAVGLAKNRIDTHAAAPGHTVRLLMQTIAAVLGDEGDGGFYRDAQPPAATTPPGTSGGRRPATARARG